MHTEETKMTVGSPAKLIFSFALPLMFGNIFQQLYIITDTIVVGQAAGLSALAALGEADWNYWLVSGIITGFTQGFSIKISQYYGAGDLQNLKQCIVRSYKLTAIISFFILLGSQLLIRPVLLLLQTPENILPLSILYLRIIFAAIPVVAAYNIFAALLRSVGNSRSPFIAMVVASIINILLDILFVGFWHQGIAGAAIATVIAQTFSAFCCLISVRKSSVLSIKGENSEKNLTLSLQLLNLGQPMAFQNLIISIGGLAVQYVINGYGFLFVAGFTATNKLYGLIELAAISYGYAITTYVGQNHGAGNMERIRKGLHSSLFISLATSLLITLLMIFCGRSILSLFISGTPEHATSVMEIAYRYLFLMSVFLWVLYLLYVYRSSLQGLGNTFLPMLSSFIELAMRLGAIFLLPLFMGSQGVFLAEVCAWTGAALFLAISYYCVIRKQYKRKKSGKSSNPEVLP